MDDFRDIADRFEITALAGAFADAAMTRDYDRFAALFTEDAIWRIPPIADFTGRAEIRTGIERLQGSWDYFIQHAHPGSVRVDGDTATGRAYIAEYGRMRDGSAHLNYSLYHDRYRRTPDGWRFTARVYEVVHVEGVAPLPRSG